MPASADPEPRFPPRRFRAMVTPDRDGVATCVEAAQAWAAARQCGRMQQHRLGVVLEELLLNAGLHGRAQKAAVRLQANPGGISVLLCDNGVPFDMNDPRGPPDEVGGLGLVLVGRFAGPVLQRRRNGCNMMRLAVATDGG